MRFIHAKIKGLIGVYRGSGIKELDIDFTRCRHKVVLIMGGNGSGKSTLIDTLHPLPDPQSNYIPGEECYKELIYQMGNIIYRTYIVYPVNRHGERTTTKAYISKSVDGSAPLELNPNGNVSSYRECLYSEFNLDANFAALTSLSIEDKGLVGKTPAKRKEFVISIVSKVEVFNNIYKTLNKRSSIFKSMINSLVTKIDSIGSEENIEHTLSSIDTRIKQLLDRRDMAIKKLSGAESVASQLDTGGEIQRHYTDLRTQLQMINTQINTLSMFITNYSNQQAYKEYVADKDTVADKCTELEKEVVKLSTQLDNKKDQLQTLLKEKEEDSKALSIKTSKIDSLRSQHTYEEMFKLLKETNERISRFQQMISEMGLTEDTTLTKDEFILGLNTLRDIKEQIDTVRSFNYDYNMQIAISDILDNVSTEQQLRDIELVISDTRARLEQIQQDIAYNTGLVEKMEILSNRPGKCSIDNCPFISNALLAKKENPEQKLVDLQNELKSLQETLESLTSDRDQIMKTLQVRHSIEIILRMINSNRSILDKLPNGSILTNRSVFFEQLRLNGTFNNIYDLYQYIDYANMFEEYRRDKELLVKLESEYKIYQSRASILEAIYQEISELEESLHCMVEKIQSYNDEIFDMEALLQSKQAILEIVKSVRDKYSEYDRLCTDRDRIESDIRAIATNMEAIEQATRDINEINTEIISIDNELNPIKEERDTLKFSLNKLKEYRDELAVFQAKYDKIEIIKKYSSPTKGGIQTLFINVYMGQTLRIANKLLSMFFNGKLRLLDYVIDETQFAIPCTSIESDINNDDISSCSGGEKCMISMILSFALLQQSSTKYNILRLDEIDGTLDQSNRGMFMEVLNIIIDELNMENCLMISHASESVLDNVDIICLNMDGLGTPRGNVIYSVNE